MKDRTESSSAACGEVVHSRNDRIVAYDPGVGGGALLFFEVDDIHDLLSSTVAKIVVHEGEQVLWSAQTRRYGASTPLQALALELVGREPSISVWAIWERKAQLSSSLWFDEPTDFSAADACIQHVNKTIKSYLHSSSPKDGVIGLLNFQTHLCYAIDNAARCVRLLTEKIATRSAQPLALAAQNWVYRAVELGRNGKQDESLDIIFDNLDEMLLRGEFEECDSVLATMPVSQLSNAQLITVLTATLAAKKELRNREVFFCQVHSVLKARDSDVDALLRGLE